MAHYLDYIDTLDELASKAYSGDYGDAPFDPTTPGGEALFRDAFDKVGVHDLESWLNGSGDGGSIMESIQTRFNGHIIDNDAPDSISAAFDVTAREQATIEYAPAAKTMDDVVLEADDKQQQVDLLASRNDAKMERGEPITTLSAETLETLKANGVDVSALEKQFGITSEAASGVDKHEAESNASVEVTEGNADERNATNDSVSSQVEGEKEVIVEMSSDTETAGSGVEVDEKVAIEDLVFEDEDGNQISFQDILADLCESDDDINAILSKAVEIADRGEDPRPFMEDAIADYEAKHSAGANVEADVNSGADNETHAEGNDSSSNDEADSSDAKPTYETKFEYHSERIDERKSHPVSLKGDTFTAYHEMAKVYNAHKGGIEINGKIPTKLDVAVSVLNFTRTNILETLVIEAIRTLITKKEDDKDNVEVPEQDKVTPPADKYGIEENGNIGRGVSPEEAREIGNYRSVLPEAGRMFGADMTKVDRGSTPDVTVRSTNPDGANGRGVSVTLDDAKKYTIPDVRLVDIKGERLLVDPFGKIMEVVSPGDKYKVGQVLSGLDVSSRGMGKEALETYARDHGISIDQAKDEISHAVKERFCERIESGYKVEASAIERMVLPRELEMKADLQSKLANIENIEKGVTSPEERAEIEQMKADVSKAIETIDERIEALRSRQADLEHSGAKPSARSTNDRFADAVSSEKKAVGRSVFTTDLGIDRGKIQERVSAGVEAIKARVEAHNASVPEKDRISYDSKTGDFVDRYGISDKGEYVGNKNGNFMDDPASAPATKEDIAKYIEDHMDPSRFADTDKILAGSEVERPEPDVERPEAEEALGVEAAEAPDVEAVENNEVENNETSDTEITDQSNVEGNADNEANVENKEPTDIEQSGVDQNEGSNVEQNASPEVEQKERADLENTQGSEVENKEASDVENQELSTIENTNVENNEQDNVESTENADVDNAENVSEVEVTGTEDTEVSDATEAAVAENVEDGEDDNVENSTEEESDATELENADNNDEEGSNNVETEETENTEVDETSEKVTSDEDDEGSSVDNSPGAKSDNGAAVEEEAEIDDLDDVEAGEKDGEVRGGSTEDNADVQAVEAKDAIEARGSGGEDDDVKLDPTSATDGDVEADHNEDDDKGNWVDDLKSHLDDYIEGCMKQITDPIGYEADKIDAEIDLICNIVELFGGDVSGLREAAHELVSSAVDAITNIGDPTAQEAMKEAFCHLFEELGFRLEDPSELFDPMITEYNDSIGTEKEELIDDLTDAYCDGAGAAQESLNDIDANFDSVHLDEDTLVTNEGVVDEIGQTTGEITDETAPEIEREINEATVDNVQQEIEHLDPDSIDPATVGDAAVDVVETEAIDAPDADVTMEDIPDVDITDVASDAASTLEEIGSAAEGAEGIEILAALL